MHTLIDVSLSLTAGFVHRLEAVVVARDATDQVGDATDQVGDSKGRSVLTVYTLPPNTVCIYAKETVFVGENATASGLWGSIAIFNRKAVK